ncbi:serine endoprotease DegS [Oxobacter pfennigii]|uniref:Serine endoprotease DegS n=1 Tax=Oxobacter pfennigii TaxID=36849 RepID=A0A0P8W693_9CLOT|nr:S1C family serine protease [Oxobacter pfennigii]KPU43514.1 serine endoprotease DegS [Oxobacter pfennigii]
MKRNQKTALNIAIAVFMVLISFFLPSIKSSLNQAMNREFIEKAGKYALSANIKIVQLEYSNGENISSISVSAGTSGVIIRKEGDKYYALTAKHVIEESDDMDKTQIVVMGYDDLDYADSLKKGGEFQGIADYYKQFSQAAVEYSNDKYDLAVISFSADEVYNVLPVADEIPRYGDVIASMSNPYDKRNIITAGKISSRKPVPFGDEAGKLQYPIIKHTAALSQGSSGSALLNENLEIAGINLGGSENILRQYISGMAMPNDLILNFLEEWEHYRSERKVRGD